MKLTLPKDDLPMTSERRELAQRSLGLVNLYLKLHHLHGETDRECCIDGLIHAAITYEAARGSFSTFALRCMHAERCDELRYRARHEPVTVSLDAPIRGEEGAEARYEVTPEEGTDLCGGAEAEEIRAELFRTAGSELAREIFRLRLRGMTQKQVAARLRIGQATVSRVLAEEWNRYERRRRAEDEGAGVCGL